MTEGETLEAPGLPVDPTQPLFPTLPTLGVTLGDPVGFAFRAAGLLGAAFLDTAFGTVFAVFLVAFF